MSLIGAAGLAAALLVGCGDNDAKPVSSKVGQSCVRTADCADGLSCIANVCYSTTSPSGGEAGSGGAAAVGPVLGGEGESCTSRRDCKEGLACFNQRCSADTTGAGGDTGATTAQLGARGETCRVNADCTKDLVCIPSNFGLGVCDETSFGITPTGKVCGGECSTATDCCQLPTFEQANEGIKSCPDLAALITAELVDCTATQVTGSLGGRLCFLDATYCSGCTATTWKCTNNACVYNQACVVAAGVDAPKGCPAYSRLDLAVPTCNAKTLKCTSGAGCTTDASCLDVAIVDSTSFDTCSDGECTCYTGNHACYRKCTRDLDCATGKVCDKTSSLCVPDKVCNTDAECAERSGSLDFKCQTSTHTCIQSCINDSDCSGTGHIVGGIATSTFNRNICSDGVCTSVLGDCSDDSQCGAVGGYKTFCIDRPAVAAGTTVSSAITN
ncbi:MAG TPA: hypothetical protein VNW92_13755 [Polyangiaceae bacterium]|jgi:hypothetical protein|nr:hypothetical protein [Polyangiaceae bacterium]